MNTLNFTAGQLRAVAQKHVQMFERRIASGGPNVRVEECEMYRDIWLDLIDSIQHADEDIRIEVDSLSPKERAELLDAYACGEYDDILAPKGG